MSSEKEKLLQQMAELADRLKQSKAKLLSSAKQLALDNNQSNSFNTSISSKQSQPQPQPQLQPQLPPASTSAPSIAPVKSQDPTTDTAFALNYDLISEPPKLPCDKWPHCTRGAGCHKQHPSAAELSKPPGPLGLEDIVPLVTPFKNSTVALEKLHFMLNNRAYYRTRFNELLERGLASNINPEKARQLAEQVLTAQLQNSTQIPSVVTQDQVLQAMGLQDSLHLAMALAQSSKVTSERAWSAEHGCYFAVMKHEKAFLVRHYQLTSRAHIVVADTENDQDITIVIEAKERRNVNNIVLSKNVVHDQEGCTIVVEPKKRRITEPEQEFVSLSGFKSLNGVPIQKENKGFSMLERLGWKRGTGLGKNNHGLQAPVAVPFFVGRAGLTGECDEHVDSSYLDSNLPAQTDLLPTALSPQSVSIVSQSPDAISANGPTTSPSSITPADLSSSLSSLIDELSTELLIPSLPERSNSVDSPKEPTTNEPTLPLPKKAKKQSSDDFRLFMKEANTEPSTVKDFDLYSGLD